VYQQFSLIQRIDLKKFQKKVGEKKNRFNSRQSIKPWHGALIN
jgi:prolyl-tRNA editing enzyme YbaK/EbsC (Cys-tRNA(Pro) deacylase)